MRNDSVMEGIKNSIESLICRGRFYGSRYKQAPALSPCIFTANTFRPEEEALSNRYEILDFTFSERKPTKNKKEFNDKFKPKSLSEEAPLTKLKAIGAFTASRIIEDEGLLRKDWKPLSEELLTEAFKFVGLDVPSWVEDWADTETIEDIEEETYIMVLDLLKHEINKAYNVKIQIIDEDGKRETPDDKITEDITKKDFSMVRKAHHVISSTSISWLAATKIKGEDFIIISFPFVKIVNSELGLSQSLKSLAEILGWKEGQTKIGVKNVKSIKVKKNDFYSAISDDEFKQGQTKL